MAKYDKFKNSYLRYALVAIFSFYCGLWFICEDDIPTWAIKIVGIILILDGIYHLLMTVEKAFGVKIKKMKDVLRE